MSPCRCVSRSPLASRALGPTASDSPRSRFPFRRFSERFLVVRRIDSCLDSGSDEAAGLHLATDDRGRGPALINAVRRRAECYNFLYALLRHATPRCLKLSRLDECPLLPTAGHGTFASVHELDLEGTLDISQKGAPSCCCLPRARLNAVSGDAGPPRPHRRLGLALPECLAPHPPPLPLLRHPAYYPRLELHLVDRRIWPTLLGLLALRRLPPCDPGPRPRAPPRVRAARLWCTRESAASDFDAETFWVLR